MEEAVSKYYESVFFCLAVKPLQLSLPMFPFCSNEKYIRVMKSVYILNFLLAFSALNAQHQDSLRAIELSNKGYEHAMKAEFAKSITYFSNAVQILEANQFYDLALKHRANLMQAYIENANLDSAISVGLKGIEMAKSKDQPDHKDVFFRKMGIVYNKLSHHNKALEYFTASEEYRKERYGKDHLLYAKSLNAVAAVLITLQKFDLAKDKLIQGIEIMDQIGESVLKDKVYLLQTLGSVYHSLGDYRKMLDSNEKGLKICLEIFEEDNLLTAHAYQNIGLSYYNLDEPNKSNSYHEKSIDMRQKLLGVGHPALIINYNSMSLNYFKLNEGPKCVEMATKAYEISQNHYGDTSSYTLKALSNMISGYNIMGQVQKARELLSKVVSMKLALYGENHNQVAVAYHQLADSYRFGGNPSKSIPIYHKAMAIREKLWKHHSQLATIYASLSWAHYDNGSYDSALVYANKSLNASSPNSDVTGLNWPQLDGYISYTSIHNAIQVKIFTLYRLADKYPEDKELYFRSSLAGSQLMDSLMIDQQRKMTFDMDRLRFASDAHQAVHSSLYITHTLLEITKDPSYHEQMFYFNERAKSNALFARTVSKRVENFAGIPKALLEKEKHLLDSMEMIKNALKSDIISTADSILPTQKQALFGLEEEYLTLRKTIQNEYPKYHDLKYAQPPVSVGEVQAFLAREESVLIEYFLETGSIYISVISQDTICSFSVDFDQSDPMLNKVMAFRESILSVNDTLFRESSMKLYKLLIAPIRPLLDDINASSLIIIPDGSLHYLPFELLIDSTGTYLMENWHSYYAPSASILLNQTSHLFSNDLISFAPKFEGSTTGDVIRNKMAAIPGAIAEVQQLSEIFSNTSFINELATEAAFRNESSDYGIIHLATHAIIDENSDDLAKLIFSTQGDTVNDGYLHSYEIYNLNLNAHLVTLSACNTGFGKIRKGEGVMSLSRAFAYAGVPATVVSLWPASDKSTPELMKYFYQNLRDGQTKDIALNNARKQYLAHATGKAKHPFYWGGFVLIGDNRAIEEETNILVYVIPFLLIIALMLIVLSAQKKSLIDCL